MALNKLDLLSMIKSGQNDKDLSIDSTLSDVGWSRGSFLWMGRIIPSADAGPERPDYYGLGGEHYQWWRAEMDELLAGSWGTAAQQRRGLGSGSGSGSPSDDSMDPEQRARAAMQAALAYKKKRQGGGAAADAYGRITENFGAMLTTSGPGATNLLTSICNAYFDSIPFLIVATQLNL